MQPVLRIQILLGPGFLECMLGLGGCGQRLYACAFARVAVRTLEFCTTLVVGAVGRARRLRALVSMAPFDAAPLQFKEARAFG